MNEKVGSVYSAMQAGGAAVQNAGVARQRTDFAQRGMAGRAAGNPALKPCSLTRKAVKSRRCRDRAKECNRASRRLTWTLKSDGQQGQDHRGAGRDGRVPRISCYRAAVDLLSAMVAHYEGQFSAGKLPADRLLEIATAARQCRLIRQSLIDGHGAIAPTL